MGFEYQFHLSEQDKQTLARNPDGIDSLEKLLQSAPGYIGTGNGIYAYSEAPDNPERWPSSASLNADGFLLCIYSRKRDTLDQQLLDYLIRELLDRCGRVEVEDA